MKCICGKEFENKRSLAQHEKQYCNEYKQIQQEKYEKYKFVCICSKRFEKEKSLHGHRSKCNIYQKWLKNEFENILTYDFLYEKLIKKKLSALSISQEIKKDYIRASDIIRKAKELGIKTRSIKEVSIDSKTRDKYKETCIKKYGKENTLSKGTKGYNKKNKTIKEKYNVENVFQLKDVKEKSKKTMLHNYGVENPVYIENRYKNNGRKSKIHIKVEKWLLEKCINFTSEKVHSFKKFNDVLGREYNPRPDITIKDKKIIIEIKGDYWHGNPKKYKINDIVVKWTGEELVKNIWEFDNLRKKQMESFGYKVIELWEYDIVHSFNYIEELLCKELELNQ